MSEPLLQACINGARRPGAHPALATRPADVAADVVRVAQAGAGAVHVHAKDDGGDDSLAPSHVEATVTAIRAVAAGVPLGLSTGAWAMPDPTERARAVATWRELPDFASVNWHEPGADDVAAVLIECGVGVEAGLWHEEGVDRWLASPLRDRCLRVLVELPDGLDAEQTVRRADALLGLLGDAGVTLPVQLHGEGSSCWPALRYAAELGLESRVGLEDVLELPDGTAAPDNAALVAAARAIQASAVLPTPSARPARPARSAKVSAVSPNLPT